VFLSVGRHGVRSHRGPRGSGEESRRQLRVVASLYEYSTDDTTKPLPPTPSPKRRGGAEGGTTRACSHLPALRLGAVFLPLSASGGGWGGGVFLRCCPTIRPAGTGGPVLDD